MKSRSIWTALVLVIIALVVVLIILQPRDQEPGKIRLVYKKNANYLIYFVAKEKGYFKEEGLEIDAKIVESSNLMVQALGTGQADFNPSNSVPSLYSAELASPGTFKILYLMLMTKGRSNDAILVKKDSPLIPSWMGMSEWDGFLRCSSSTMQDMRSDDSLVLRE